MKAVKEKMAKGFGNPSEVVEDATSAVVTTYPEWCRIYSKAQQVDLRSYAETGSKESQPSHGEANSVFQICVCIQEITAGLAEYKVSLNQREDGVVTGRKYAALYKLIWLVVLSKVPFGMD